MDSNMIKEKIGFMGGGNMAWAICEGLVNKGKPIKYLSLNSIPYLLYVLRYD